MSEHLAISISALEHWSYCPRQCGLIHIESVWDENVFTVRGTAVHERADTPEKRQERGVRVERALPIWSEKTGLVGRADVVEFRKGSDGSETVSPVEYKSGGPAHQKHAEVQLCAQAMCLEEMLGREVKFGYLYFAKTRARVEVEITENLRHKTIQIIELVRSMNQRAILPPPVNDRRCPQCSLVDACMPGPISRAIAKLPDAFVPRAEAELP